MQGFGTLRQQLNRDGSMEDDGLRVQNGEPPLVIQRADGEACTCRLHHVAAAQTQHRRSQPEEGRRSWRIRPPAAGLLHLTRGHSDLLPRGWHRVAAGEDVLQNLISEAHLLFKDFRL